MKNRNRRWIGRAAALGRAIGAKPSRRGGRRFPKDGDGDGFYSPRPGMPDKTPVPPEFSAESLAVGNQSGRIGGRIGYGRGVPEENFNREAQQRALQAAKNRENRVKQKFGDVRSKRKARRALYKVFPNARLNDFLKTQGDELTPVQYHYVVALLDMGDRYPKVADKVVSFGDYKSDALGGMRLVDRGKIEPFNYMVGEWGGSQIQLNNSADFEDHIDRLVSFPDTSLAPWSLLMTAAMRKSNNTSKEDRRAVDAQAVAIHEFGHAMHTHFALDWHGATDSTEKYPTTEYFDAFLEAFDVFFYELGFDELDDQEKQTMRRLFQRLLDEAQAQQPINDPENNHERILLVSEELFKQILAQNPEMDDALSPGDERNFRHLWSLIIQARTLWDGVPEEDRFEIRRNLIDNSLYAMYEPNHASRYLEGVAETITAMEFGYVPPSDITRSHIDEIQAKQDRPTLKLDMSDKEVADAARSALRRKMSFPTPPACTGLGIKDFKKLQTNEFEPQRPVRRLKGKALGVPIGAGDDEPHDGDGDGNYTAVPGGEDNVPMPPDTDLVEWDEIEKIIDWDVFPRRGLYDDEMEFLDQNAESSWRFWNSCRAIRKAAYRLAGLSPDVRDPNIERSDGYFGSGFEVAEDDEEYTEYARYYMGLLAMEAKRGRRKGKLYRAVDVTDDDREAFEQIMQPGNFVDIPLLATADRRSQGPNDFLRMYGTDYLIEIDEDAAREPLSGGFGPFYTEADEDDTLSTIEFFIEDLKEELATEDFDDEEKENRKQFIESLRELLDQYEEARKKTTDEREAAREALEFELADYELAGPWRWAGEEVDMGSDSRRYYDAFEDDDKDEYSEELPRETITGGRFEVIEVVDDPEGRYGRIIRLRQIGVFDPQNRGRIVPTRKGD